MKALIGRVDFLIFSDAIRGKCDQLHYTPDLPRGKGSVFFLDGRLSWLL